MSARKNTLDGLFSGIEDITDARGRLLNTVLYNKAGSYSSIFEVENPVQQYCTDADQYYAFMNVLDHILQTLGEGYALQKQDIFCRQAYHHDITRYEPLSLSLRKQEGAPLLPMTRRNGQSSITRYRKLRTSLKRKA